MVSTDSGFIGCGDLHTLWSELAQIPRHGGADGPPTVTFSRRLTRLAFHLLKLDFG